MSTNRSIATQTLTKEEKAAVDSIQGHRGLVKMVSDSEMNPETNTDTPSFKYIDFLLDQINDPVKNRPSRSAYFFSRLGLELPVTVKKTNLKTGEVHDHKPGQCRYMHHKGVDYQHTLKYPCSLLPREPQYMELFPTCDIGFGWDINACNLKNEKYVWPSDQGTETCFWFHPDPDYTPDPVTSIAALRAVNDEAVAQMKTIDYPELLVGFPKKRVDWLLLTCDQRDQRLRMWDVMQHTKEKLGYASNIPIVISESYVKNVRQGSFGVYQVSERAEDLSAHQFDIRLLSRVGIFAHQTRRHLQMATKGQHSLMSGLIGF